MSQQSRRIQFSSEALSQFLTKITRPDYFSQLRFFESLFVIALLVVFSVLIVP